MLLRDFLFDEQGAAGAPVHGHHYVDVVKRIDINTERPEFDVTLTIRPVPGSNEGREEKTWVNLDPVAAQCIIWEIFEGRHIPQATVEPFTEAEADAFCEQGANETLNDS